MHFFPLTLKHAYLLSQQKCALWEFTVYQTLVMLGTIMNKKSLFLSELSLIFIDFGPDFSKNLCNLAQTLPMQIFRVPSGSLESGFNISLFSLPNRNFVH